MEKPIPSSSTITLICPGCDGTGRQMHDEPPRSSPCAVPCQADNHGVHQVVINPEAIVQALVSTGGSRQGRFRAGRPDLPEHGGTYGAAYVWQAIRVRAGVDLLALARDPGLGRSSSPHAPAVLTALDTLVTAIGARFFGERAMADTRWTPLSHGGDARATPGGSTTVTFGQLAAALGVGPPSEDDALTRCLRDR